MSRFQDFLNKLKRKEATGTLNGGMLAHLSERIVGEVLSRKETAVVGLLGLAFKENVSDIRNSSSIKLLKVLTSEIRDVIVYDPLVVEPFVAEKADNIDVNRAQDSKKRAESHLHSEETGVDIARAELALARALNRISVADFHK